MMNRFLFVVVCLFVTACSENNACSVSNPEKFEKFFEHYSGDKVFSSKRTEFPLEVLTWEYGLDESGKDVSGSTTSLTSESDFEKWPTITEFMAKSPLKYEVKSLTSTAAAVHLFQPDTDYSMLYHFKVVNGCWCMWRFENESL
jgi:hypothetical protein